MHARVRVLTLALPLAACADAGPPAAGADAGVIVATVHPVGAIVSAVAGESAEVAVLLPPGAHADTWEPTPRTAQAVARADLIVRVGSGLDDWVGTGSTDAAVVVLAEDEGNPHVWLDPVRVRDDFLPRISAALAGLHPDRADGIRARAAAFADSLTALDGEIRALLDGVPTRRFIAAHPAWTHFAERYGLEQVGVVHPSPGEEIGTRELARLVESARTRGVRAVIAEPQLGRAGVVALADELHVAVEVADPIGGAGVEGREGYLELMRWNARAFARALGGGP